MVKNINKLCLSNSDFSRNTPAMLYLAAIALLLSLLRTPFIISNPFFTGDSGYRMMYASDLIVCMQNRCWLPFLQAHILLFYKLKLPYCVFKFIPCFYFFLALLFLGKLAYEIGGKNRSAFYFSLLLMFCFAYQQNITFLSVNLYQEMLEIALFYILLYSGALDLRKSKLLLAVAGIALLTRDTFLVYLFAITLLNYKKIIFVFLYYFG